MLGLKEKQLKFCFLSFIFNPYPINNTVSKHLHVYPYEQPSATLICCLNAMRIAASLMCEWRSLVSHGNLLQHGRSSVALPVTRDGCSPGKDGETPFSCREIESFVTVISTLTRLTGQAPV